MKGQVTVFIIIAAVILIVLGAYFIVQRNVTQSEIVPARLVYQSDPNSEAVRGLVKDCLARAVDTTLLKFGLQGGYIYPRVLVDSLYVDGFDVPLYVYDGKPLIPDMDMLVGTQFASGVEESVLECVDEFSAINARVDFSFPRASASLDANRLTVDYLLPAKVIYEDKVVVVSPEYSYSRKTGLDRALAIAKKIASDPDSGRGLVDVSYASSVADSGYNITVFPYDNGRFFYVLTDNTERVMDIPFRFQFGLEVAK